MNRTELAATILFAGFLVALTITGLAFIWAPWPTNIGITGFTNLVYLWLYENLTQWADGE